MQQLIENALKESLLVKEEFIKENSRNLMAIADKIVKAFTQDRKLILCGNGGSAADSQHIVAKFVNGFELERPPLPAIALSTDVSIITSIGNNNSFADIFKKQIQSIGVEGDVLLALCTSGNSPNIISAVKTAKNLEIYTIVLSGKDGGELVDLADLTLVVKSEMTARIQETHIFSGHIICQLVDHLLFHQAIVE